MVSILRYPIVEPYHYYIPECNSSPHAYITALDAMAVEKAVTAVNSVPRVYQLTFLDAKVH